MLDKAIEHGKEHRKQYMNSKLFDRTCCNHGSCSYCMSNRLAKHNRKLEKVEQELKEYLGRSA